MMKIRTVYDVETDSGFMYIGTDGLLDFCINSRAPWSQLVHLLVTSELVHLSQTHISMYRAFYKHRPIRQAYSAYKEDIHLRLVCRIER